MTKATQKPLTFTAAKAACRELGYTLRKEVPGESGLVLYRVGTGADSAAAYFTDCPVDALATCRAMAADTEAGRVTLTGKPATAAAVATVAAEDNRAAAADYTRDYAGDSAAEARRLMADAKEALAMAAEAPAAYDATAAHWDACRAIATGRHVADVPPARLDPSCMYLGTAPTPSLPVTLAELGEAFTGPRSLSAAANPEAPAPRKARLKSRKALAEAAKGEGIAAELAGLSLAALPPLASDSGGFPLYAFRGRRAIDPEELDSMIYGPAYRGHV